MVRLAYVAAFLTGWMLMSVTELAAADPPLVFISSFAAKQQGAIQAYHLNLATGALTAGERTDDVEHPFFIAVSPDQKFLYSIHAVTFSGKDPEELAAYRIENRSGRLTLLNRQTTRGTASCFVEVDQTGRSAVVANYTTGDVTSYSIREDGTLAEPVSYFRHVGSSVNPSRQKEPHAHGFAISPNNRFAYAADLGIDQIVCYAFDVAAGKLTPNVQPFVRTPPGTGPRHLTFHPHGNFLYVINELTNSVTQFDFLPEQGVLVEKQTISTLPDDFAGVSHCADLKITPNGKFLYGTNRGHDSLAAYRIADDGSLSLIGITPSLGKGPQNLAITADGKWLLCANMPGNNVAVFQIGDEGTLQSAGTPIEQVSPSCVRILESPPASR